MIEEKLKGKELSDYIKKNILSTYEKMGLKMGEVLYVWGKVCQWIDNKRFSIAKLNMAIEFYKHNKDTWYELWINSMKDYNITKKKNKMG